MAGEVTATGAPTQATKTRATELEQNQAARQAAQPSRNEGVEVRISREAAQPTEAPDLTYENLRPRGGEAPEAQASVEAEQQAQAERAVLEEASAREAAAREAASDSRQAGL